MVRDITRSNQKQQSEEEEEVNDNSGRTNHNNNNRQVSLTPANRQHQQRLLCCVCQEQNTTYHYEVVYSRSAGVNTADQQHLLPPAAEHSPVIAGLFAPTRICYSSDDSTLIAGGRRLLQHQQQLPEEEEQCYYNFPPRHPRHGHLKWALTTPVGPLSVPTYPDYPVHIKTNTLRKVVVSTLTRNRSGEETTRVLERREIEVTSGELAGVQQGTDWSHFKDNLHQKFIKDGLRRIILFSSQDGCFCQLS